MLCHLMVETLTRFIRGVFLLIVDAIHLLCGIVGDIIHIVQVLVETVCSVISEALLTVRRVVNRICRRLPRWLRGACRAIVKLLDVIRWIQRHVCQVLVSIIEVVHAVQQRLCELIDRILRFGLGTFLESAFGILKWPCWLLNWIPRSIQMARCKAGDKSSRVIRICVRVLSNSQGDVAADRQRIEAIVAEVNAVLAQCNVRIVVEEIETVRSDRFFDTDLTSAGERLGSNAWFSQHQCGCCNRITVFVTGSMQGAGGFTPAQLHPNWLVIDGSHARPGLVIVHELLHLAGAFRHSDDPNSALGSGSKINHCCLLRTATFSQPVGEIGLPVTPETTPDPNAPGGVRGV